MIREVYYPEVEKEGMTTFFDKLLDANFHIIEVDEGKEWPNRFVWEFGFDLSPEDHERYSKLDWYSNGKDCKVLKRKG